ncbi:hypothetical protein KAW50_04100 [candidate division WOR-3 bacterium]|nr:hypothetical protein [candidate division WOR-3 bacterium]
MMNVEEIEIEIKKQKDALAKLEDSYEAEQDESKQQKLEWRMNQKEDAVNVLIERQQKLLDKEAEEAEKDNGKDKNVEEEDLDVCSECGGDLVLIGKDENGVDVYECEQCKELFLDE